MGLNTCAVTADAPWTGAGFGQVYHYDTYSNRWLNASGTVPLVILQPTGPASGTGAFDTATNRFHSANFGGTYDGAGQMTAQSSASSPITRADDQWDAAGKRVESKYNYGGSENTNTFAYDGLGNRVKKPNPLIGDTVFVYDVFGNMAAEYGAGAMEACSPCYLFRDPVGTVRMVVDQTQTVMKRYGVMPFGEQISAGTGWANGRSGNVYSPFSTVKWPFWGELQG